MSGLRTHKGTAPVTSLYGTPASSTRGEEVPVTDLLGLEVSTSQEPPPPAPVRGKDARALVIATPPAETNQSATGGDLGHIMEEVLRLAKTVSEMQKDHDRAVHPPWT